MLQSCEKGVPLSHARPIAPFNIETLVVSIVNNILIMSLVNRLVLNCGKIATRCISTTSAVRSDALFVHRQKDVDASTFEFTEENKKVGSDFSSTNFISPFDLF